MRILYAELLKKTIKNKEGSRKGLYNVLRE
jgi:hypothetical protein